MIQARENWFRPVRTSIAYPLDFICRAVWICKPQLRELLADSDLLDDRFVALGVVGFEVVEQAATPADHHEKAAARAVVFLVQFEVFRQLGNASAQQRDLDFRAAGVAVMRAVLSNEFLLLLDG